MVSAELSHNPFLLETEVLFNGRAPRFNSAAKKHEHQALVEWAREVPRIFRDEMNGYDFDLFFSGTDSDYARVERAFRAEGAPEGSVRFCRIGMLKGASDKRDAVLELMRWLQENPNGRFDFDAMVKASPALVDEPASLLALHGMGWGDLSLPISVEVVETASELDGADLSGLPIVMFFSLESEQQSIEDLERLLQRRDVLARQLFFVIHPALDRTRIVRVLTDLGVREPQVVGSVDDEAIRSYLEDYPITEYVRGAIRAFKGEVDRIAAELSDEYALSEQSGALEQKKIQECEREINSLKEADEALSRLVASGNLKEFDELKRSFFRLISDWKSRKRKIEGEVDARVAAKEYEQFIIQKLDGFIKRVDAAANEANRRASTRIVRTYEGAKVDVIYRPAIDSSLPRSEKPTYPDFKEEMLAHREVAYVEQRNDFLAFFGVVEANPGDRVKVVTNSLDKWRESAQKLCEPLIDSVIEGRYEALRLRHQELVGAYRSHIGDILEERYARKEAMVAQLSGDARALQKDGDWLESFNDRLQEIERG